jgi:hypothetical protein
MLFVISDEIIPETHKKETYRTTTYGILIGFVVIALLNDKTYWNMGGKSLLDSAISIISGLKFKQ